MRCTWCKKEIRSDQTAFRITPGVFVHYKSPEKCKENMENEVHISGRMVALYKRLIA